MQCTAGEIMYSLRSKRNIAHIGSIDPNTADLKLLLSGADWILCELLRQNTPTSSADAEHVVASVLTPLSPVLEDIDGQKVVFGGSTPVARFWCSFTAYIPQG